MGGFESRIHGIKERVLSDRFPELSPIEIRIYVEESSDELLGYGELSGGGYYIDVDRAMEKATDTELYGGMGHELAHISIDERKNFASRIVTDLVYGLGMLYQRKDGRLNSFDRLLNRNVYRRCYGYVSQDERNADLLMVQRGGGEELLAFLKFHDRHYKRYRPDDGLTVKELQQILYLSDDRN